MNYHVTNVALENLSLEHLPKARGALHWLRLLVNQILRITMLMSAITFSDTANTLQTIWAIFVECDKGCFFNTRQ